MEDCQIHEPNHPSECILMVVCSRYIEGNMTLEEIATGRPNTQRLLRQAEQLPVLIEVVVNTALIKADSVSSMLAL